MKWGGLRKDGGDEETGKPSTFKWSIFGPSLYFGGSCTRIVFCPAENVEYAFSASNVDTSIKKLQSLLTTKIDL